MRTRRRPAFGRLSTFTLCAVAGGLVFGATTFVAQQAPPVQAPPAVPSDPAAPFHTHVVATGIRGGYQVLAVDLNKDGRLDLVGLGSTVPELTWYENPYWTPHVLVRGVPRMVNMDAMDVDGDGVPEIALAYGFTLNPKQGTARLGILKAGPDPREPWTLTQIDAVPTSHRARFARIDGRPLLVHAPIIGWNAPGTSDPERTVTPLHAYRPPQWTRETVTEDSLGVVHDLLVHDWDGDGQDDLLTAGYQGVFVHSWTKARGWTRTRVVQGDPGDWPRGGSSEIAVGRLGGRKIFATNEPFHGTQVVVYQPSSGGDWSRTVIDTRLNNSHTIAMLDADGDGASEIVAGGTRGAARGQKPGVFLYRAGDAAASTWSRFVLDAAIGANGCVVADINADRKADVACIDNSDPWSLRWYENARK